MKYDYERLDDFCEEQNIFLCDDYSLEKLTAFSVITGKCKTKDCVCIFTKEFRSLIRANGYCVDCGKMNAKIKLKATWFEKYGVEHISKLDEIKDKVKKTSLERYGSECSLLNTSVKEKGKKTCLEKYGVEYFGQSEQFKEKSRKSSLEKYGVEYYSQTHEFKDKYKNTCLEKYGVEHTSQLEKTKEKVKLTSLEKYGVEYYQQSPECKKEFKGTFLSKYGVDSPFKIEEVKEKGKQTCLEKYGVEYYSQSQKMKEQSKETSLEKYGVNHYTKTQEFKDRYKETCLEKYGVENSSQNKEVMDKIIKKAYKLKDFIFPSGKIEQVQGYEHYALDELIINEKIDESDIITGCKNVPTIWYSDKTCKKHRHYVDIFIPSQNRCIEVKSPWTEQINKDNIFLKQQAGKELGYNYEIWVYNGKGVRVKKYE
jgi:hypothetical protein